MTEQLRYYSILPRGPPGASAPAKGSPASYTAGVAFAEILYLASVKKPAARLFDAAGPVYQLAVVKRAGHDRNIVILTQPRGFRKKPSRLVPLFRLFMRKYPKVAEIMARRHNMYNAQLDYLYKEEQAGNVLLIFPDEPLHIRRTEKKPAELRRVYLTGRTQGEAYLEKIKTFLGTK